MGRRDRGLEAAIVRRDKNLLRARLHGFSNMDTKFLGLFDAMLGQNGVRRDSRGWKRHWLVKDPVGAIPVLSCGING
jgi:hypothetical protein